MQIYLIITFHWRQAFNFFLQIIKIQYLSFKMTSSFTQLSEYENSPPWEQIPWTCPLTNIIWKKWPKLLLQILCQVRKELSSDQAMLGQGKVQGGGKAIYLAKGRNHEIHHRILPTMPSLQEFNSEKRRL